MYVQFYWLLLLVGDGDHGDEAGSGGEGRCQESEAEDEREGAAKDGKTDHRLPETPRCLLQVLSVTCSYLLIPGVERVKGNVAVNLALIVRAY